MSAGIPDTKAETTVERDGRTVILTLTHADVYAAMLLYDTLVSALKTKKEVCVSLRNENLRSAEDDDPSF